MKYACLIYLDDATFAPMSDTQRHRIENEALDSDDRLRRTDNYVWSSALEAPAAAISVRVRDGRMSTTDGPFAETKEHLSGLIVIEARDLNDAVRLAAGIPLACYGTIEVRPLREIERWPDVEPLV